MNESKTKCKKCDGRTIFDVVSRSCIDRISDSEKLQFHPFKNRESVSDEIKGPKAHGQSIIIQGSVLVKNRSGSPHKMYEGTNTPVYPDDNLMIKLSINEIDMEVYLMTLRSDDSIEKQFWISVAIPRDSKLIIKFV